MGLPDVHEGSENLGLMAGDQLFATHLFDHGVVGTFSSVRTGPGMHRQMGIELVGTAGLLSLRGGPTTGQPLLINRRPELDPGVDSNWEAVQCRRWTPRPWATPRAGPTSASCCTPP